MWWNCPLLPDGNDDVQAEQKSQQASPPDSSCATGCHLIPPANEDNPGRSPMPCSSVLGMPRRRGRSDREHQGACRAPWEPLQPRAQEQNQEKLLRPQTGAVPDAWALSSAVCERDVPRRSRKKGAWLQGGQRWKGACQLAPEGVSSCSSHEPACPMETQSDGTLLRFQGQCRGQLFAYQSAVSIT